MEKRAREFFTKYSVKGQCVEIIITVMFASPTKTQRSETGPTRLPTTMEI